MSGLLNLRFLSLSILSALFPLSPSCVYSDDGIYRVDPVPGVQSVFSVSTSLDTLTQVQVSDSLRVTYDGTISNGEFYQVEGYLDGEGVFLSDSISGSFWLRTSMTDLPGSKILSLYFLYSTNSNSLADLVGAEAYSEQRNFSIEFLYSGTP